MLSLLFKKKALNREKFNKLLDKSLIRSHFTDIWEYQKHEDFNDEMETEILNTLLKKRKNE